MNVWVCKNYRYIINTDNPFYRSGIRLNFQKGIDPEVRRACIEFVNWLRGQYDFPIRVPIYFKNAEFVRARDGDFVSAKIFMPFANDVEPYITIATRDIYRIEIKRGKDTALAAILRSIVHELTHYYQWINDAQLTDIQAERQAIYYREKIVNEYAKTREHP